jgi:hypothetical protein
MNNAYSHVFKITNNGDLHSSGGILVINAADWGPNASKGLIFRSGYDIPNNNNYYDHNALGFNDGLSINAYDGISFCTGADTRNERMRITMGG